MTEPFWGVTEKTARAIATVMAKRRYALACDSLTPQKEPVKANPQAGDWVPAKGYALAQAPALIIASLRRDAGVNIYLILGEILVLTKGSTSECL